MSGNLPKVMWLVSGWTGRPFQPPLSSAPVLYDADLLPRVRARPNPDSGLGTQSKSP